LVYEEKEKVWLILKRAQGRGPSAFLGLYLFLRPTIELE
jgi:hypothetical protein